MRPEYDIFEKFSDGSSNWRACVSGKSDSERKLQELAEHSGNEFFAIEINSRLEINSRRRNWVKSPYVRVSLGFLLMFILLSLLAAFKIASPAPEVVGRTFASAWLITMVVITVARIVRE